MLILQPVGQEMKVDEKSRQNVLNAWSKIFVADTYARLEVAGNFTIEQGPRSSIRGKGRARMVDITREPMYVHASVRRSEIDR